VLKLDVAVIPRVAEDAAVEGVNAPWSLPPPGQSSANPSKEADGECVRSGLRR
jgi:hypothetical protein